MSNFFINLVGHVPEIHFVRDGFVQVNNPWGGTLLLLDDSGQVLRTLFHSDDARRVPFAYPPEAPNDTAIETHTKWLIPTAPV